MDSKSCRICGELKPLTEFHRASGMRDGHRSECKPCYRAISAARYRANPEPAKERVKRWQRDNAARYQENQRRWRESGRKAEADRRSHLRWKFGITPEQYDAMLAAQGGVCALCGRPPTEGISLHVDHHHATGAIRKLLCFDCNAGIGKLREDRDLLRAAATYLDAHDPDVARQRGLAQDRARALRR